MRRVVQRRDGRSVVARSLGLFIATSLAIGLTATAASAGNPHFVGTPSVTKQGNNLFASGKVAGLGNEDQIHVVTTAQGGVPEPGAELPAGGEQGDVLGRG
jgi:hypothetical protein